jgi:autotransporter-associated beta strand protein
LTWTGAVPVGSPGVFDWSTAANWDIRAPVAGDDLVFPAQAPGAGLNTTNDLHSGTEFNSITISGSGYSLSGNPITLGTASMGGSIILNQNVDHGTIALDIHMVGPQVVNVNSGANLTVSGHLSSSTDSTLTKAGTGTLILSNDNSGFSRSTNLDAIDVSQGVITITNARALGNGTTTVLQNAQLQLLNVAGQITTNLKLNGPGPINDGALLNVSGSNTWAGNIELDSETTLGASADTSLNISGQISDLGAVFNLTKEGTGQIIFSHVGGNTYRGLTTINNGILTIEDPLALGGEPPSPDNGTIVNSNSITGEIGTLQLANSGRVAQEQLVLNGTGFGGIGALDNLRGDNTWTGDITLSHTLFDVRVSSIQVESQGNTPTHLVVSGVISGAARGGLGGSGTDSGSRGGPPLGDTTGLFKTGTGTLILTNRNSISTTTIFAGTLEVDGSLGDVIINSGVLSGAGTVGAITSNTLATGNAGVIDPGDNAPGTLTSGAVVLSPNDEFIANLAHLQADGLNIVSGSVDLGGATLAGTVAPDISDGETFDVIQTDYAKVPTDVVTGQFAGASTIAYVDGSKFIVDYFPDHVALTHVLANVTVGLTASIAAPVFGQPENFVAVLTQETGAPTPTGVVDFYDNGVTLLGSGQVDANGSVSLHVDNLSGGAHSITAVYLGSVAFAPASSAPLPLEVAQRRSKTKVTATDFGRSITASVTPDRSNIPAPVGSVTFTVSGDASFVETDPLADGTATMQTKLTPGTYTILASYNGDANYLGSSDGLTVTVPLFQTRTDLVSSAPSLAAVGQTVTWTATVAALQAGAGTPPGSVSFTVDGISTTVPLGGDGTARLSRLYLAPGTHLVTASYISSSLDFASSSSTTLSQSIVPPTVTTITTSPTNPKFGQPVTITVSVTPATGSGTPAGTVSLVIDGVSHTLSTVSGSASFGIAFSRVGNHAIEAVYNGEDGAFAPSAARPLDVFVNQAESATSVVANGNIPSAGHPVTFVASVQSLISGSVPPTGTVSFSLDGVPVLTATLDAKGMASFKTSLSAGSHTLVVFYSGDDNYLESFATLSFNVVPGGGR